MPSTLNRYGFLQKRNQCFKDLHALRLSLDELRANPPATKIECEDASVQPFARQAAHSDRSSTSSR